jgi:catechol 2,3-dioxygenase-like lactoylglutathione lyase family enzyme
MKQSIIHIALLVEDYDDALDFYVTKLNFEVIEDTKLSDAKRWILIKPRGSSGCNLLLAKAANKQQLSAVGNQTGGRVFLFLETDDFYRDYNRMLAENISFVREPTAEKYGIVAVFQDLYGNLWDLIQRPA